jgi:septal ring factor EnvC (AmiA/AmiB activator)
MRGAPVALVSICAWLTLAAGSTVLAGKDSSDPIRQQIEQERRTLEKLKGEIEEKKKQADEADRKKESVLQSIQDLDDRMMNSRRERDEIARHLKQKDREIEQINGEVAALNSRLGERRGSLLARLRVQYIEGRYGVMKSLLSAKTYADLQRRYQYLSAVSRREYTLMESFRKDLERLAAAERQRAQVRGDMLVYKQRTDKKLAEIEGLKRDKNLFLAKVIDEKEASERTVAELERSAARVDGLLKELEARRRLAALHPKKGVGGASPLKGMLPWPVDGEVVSFFGRQKHRTFATHIERKGIEIRAHEGSAIRAVMAGTVEYADWLKGYGLVLILDHPNGFFSLYAHASKLLVKVGDEVREGQMIGEAGDTGMIGESMLYFELREGAEPVDPMIWLAKRP